MNEEKFSETVKRLIKDLRYSAAPPQFLILKPQNGDRLTDAIAFSIAIYGGDAIIIDCDDKSVTKFFKLCDADGLFEIRRTGNSYEILFTDEPENLSKTVILSGNGVPQIGSISTFTVEKT